METVKIKVKKPCPRCGSDEVIAYNSVISFDPQCNDCGLEGKTCYARELIASTMINAFYEYEYKNTNRFKRLLKR